MFPKNVVVHAQHKGLMDTNLVIEQVCHVLTAWVIEILPFTRHAFEAADRLVSGAESAGNTR